MAAAVLLKVDLHSHSSHSHDGWMAPRALVERAAEVGIDRIAITDHGEIEGAERARELDPTRVIVGEEIRCACGTELIGLFVSDRIPQRLALEEVVERLTDQQAIIYAPHPTAYLGQARWHTDRALAVSHLVEVFNSRAFWRPWNLRAGEEARRRGLPGFASSDAHFGWEIGRAWTEVPFFSTAEELLRVAASAAPVGRLRASPFPIVASELVARGRRLRSRRPTSHFETTAAAERT